MVEYLSARLPANLMEKADHLIGKYGFDSRADVIKAALRDFFEKYPETKIIIQPMEA